MDRLYIAKTEVFLVNAKAARKEANRNMSTREVHLSNKNVSVVSETQ